MYYSNIDDDSRRAMEMTSLASIDRMGLLIECSCLCFYGDRRGIAIESCYHGIMVMDSWHLNPGGRCTPYYKTSILDAKLWMIIVLIMRMTGVPADLNSNLSRGSNAIELGFD